MHAKRDFLFGRSSTAAFDLSLMIIGRYPQIVSGDAFNVSHKKRMFFAKKLRGGKTMSPQNFVIVHEERAICHDNICSARVAFTRRAVDR